ncbi:hypothetical protein AB4Y43_16880 [Paraburkholderia sp. BR10872]|uniref:hypothetical protein n=1 Tax=Paraburkholderia sp. BR10872 TaxID=3236989 RepID=UPI0034D38D3A
MSRPVNLDDERIAAAMIFRDIALDLLEANALDLCRPTPDPADVSVQACNARLERDEAVRWVGGGVGHMNFEMCCDALNVNAAALRRQLTADPASVCTRLGEDRLARQAATTASDREGDADELRAFETKQPMATPRPARGPV